MSWTCIRLLPDWPGTLRSKYSQMVGLTARGGVAVFVVVGSAFENCTWRTEIFGFRDILIRDAVSGFQAEIIAADAAIAFAKDLGIARLNFCAA